MRGVMIRPSKTTALVVLSVFGVANGKRENQQHAIEAHELKLQVMHNTDNCDLDEMTKASFEAMIHSSKFVTAPTVIRGYLAETKQHELEKVTTLASASLDSAGIMGIPSSNVEARQDLPSSLQEYHHVFKANMYGKVLSEAESMAPKGFMYQGSQPSNKFTHPFYAYVIKGQAGDTCSSHSDFWETAFWNGLLTGKKRWVLWSPGAHRHLRTNAPRQLETWMQSNFDDFVDSMPQMKERLITPDSQFKGHLKTCVLSSGDLIVSPGGWWHRTMNLETSEAISEQVLLPSTIPTMYRDICWGERDHLFSECADEESNDPSACINGFKDGLSRAYMCAGLHRTAAEQYAGSCCGQFVGAFANAMQQNGGKGMQRIKKEGHTALLSFLEQAQSTDPLTGEYEDPRRGRVPKFDSDRFIHELNSASDTNRVHPHSLLIQKRQETKVNGQREFHKG